MYDVIKSDSVAGILEFFGDAAIRYGCWEGARKLHNLILHNILRLPLSFMDVTPSGRILSRFSKDIDVVDNLLPDQITSLCFCLGDVCIFEIKNYSY